MTRQSLELQKVFAFLDSLTGKHTIDEITEELIRRGILRDDPESVRELLNMASRKYIAQHRKSTQKRGEIQLELVSLFEIVEREEEVEKVRFYKPEGELTPEEAAQDTIVLRGEIAQARQKHDAKHRYRTEKHGRPYLDFLGDHGPDDAKPSSN